MYAKEKLVVRSIALQGSISSRTSIAALLAGFLWPDFFGNEHVISGLSSSHLCSLGHKLPRFSATALLDPRHAGTVEYLDHRDRLSLKNQHKISHQMAIQVFLF